MIICIHALEIFGDFKIKISKICSQIIWKFRDGDENETKVNELKPRLGHLILFLASLYYLGHL